MSSFRNNLYLILLLQPVILITSCGQETELSNKSTPRYTMMEGSSCFNSRDIEDYMVLDRSNLIVYGRPSSRAYHIEISPPATSIRGSDMISFVSWSGRICGFAGDDLLIPNSIYNERHSIISVKRLDETAQYNLLVRFGKAEPVIEVQPEDDSSPEIKRELGEDEDQDKEIVSE
tara:strand:- start:45 stop:569 length:525 start_codon:yes stop_codon:yes gene_type:complete